MFTLGGDVGCDVYHMIIYMEKMHFQVADAGIGDILSLWRINADI